ncbi:hypothetical protein MM01_00017 [Escherichia phage vB_EcoS_MM01]|uniref:Uncharacterized protein n=1 Tax=Escherichia phage vB_EcoS_MM01 TaxID=2508188 RepID=A0A482N5Y0_9CAUD|nr:hypothetical protein MM01_00017 [Escherichia phage vB_EcoS_MM01]
MAIRSVALAGMVADTSLYNIDGACVVGGSAAIPVGTVVTVSPDPLIDGHKVVIAGASATLPAYGVVVKSHYETPDGTAKTQEAVNVMTNGRIWARTNLSAKPTFGSAVFVNSSGLIVAGPASDTVFDTGFTFAGGFATAYTASANPIKQDESVDGNIVEIQVKQK